MATTVKHHFTSAKADGTDVTLVKPSDWNLVHDFVTDSSTPVVLGATGPGPIVELPLSNIVPIGAVLPFAGPTAPSGWLLCFGQSLAQSAYPALYAVILQTYGAGPGPATFLLPDLRGASISGKSNMGGADRGNMPSGGILGQYIGQWYASINFNSYGVNHFDFGNVVFNQTYGAVTQGSVSAGGTSGGNQYVYVNDAVTVQGYSHVIGDIGVTVNGGSNIDIRQPTLMLNYIIKAQ